MGIGATLKTYFGFDDPGLYSLDGSAANDLRYGSEIVPRPPYPAVPSWYGVHDWAIPFNGVNSITGGTVSYTKLFHCQPWVYTCVMRLCQSANRVPLKVYRRTGDDSRVQLRPGDHPLATALATPYSGFSSGQLVMALLGSVLVHGNSTARVQSGARNSLLIDPLDWRYMRPVFRDPRHIAGWETDEDGPAETIPGDQVLHVAWWGPCGPIGPSPLQALNVTLSVEDAARAYSAQNLKNGARPPSAITVSEAFLGYEQEVRNQIIEDMRQQVTDVYSGPANAGKVAILPAGLSWDAVGHTAVEAELVDIKAQTREEIAAVYQIPPPMIGILDKATFSNIETQREMYWTESLGPPLSLIEQAINAQIVKRLLGEQDIYVEFDLGAVLRGDRLKEMQSLTSGVNSGIMTINEARSKLNLPRIVDPSADELMIAANNMKPISQVTAGDGINQDDPAAASA